MSEEPLPRLIRFYRLIWRIWKQRRFQKFVEAVSPSVRDHLLDIGGYPFNWFGRGELVGKVDVLNLELQQPGEIPEGSPEILALAGDARCLKCADNTYDIVFSNSVIEHVGSFEDQAAFATEARRAGRRLWIQTPAMGCPVEPHYLGLFIHWFPQAWHVGLARWTSVRGLSGSVSKENLQDIANTTRLMTKREFSSLFPDCEIWTERLLWVFPKSYVAIRRNTDPSS